MSRAHLDQEGPGGVRLRPVVTKNDIRNRNLERRLGLSDEAVFDLSLAIQNRLIQSEFWPESGSIALYSAVKNEVRTNTIFQTAVERGLTVYFPRVEQGLKFYEVSGPGDLQKGSWSIPEPKHGCPLLPENEKLDLLLVPGLAFTKGGQRIGYGKGFYDQVIGQVAHKAVALTYEFQVTDEVPTDEWDKIVDALITEKDLYETSLHR